MSIIAAILVFAVLVIVHEFGHFIVAKRSGVRVDEFAIGFPPRIWSIKRGETRYSINALPLGGYVLMPGENGELLDEHGNVDKRTFAAQAAGTRAAILAAGVTMNLLLAIVLYTGIFAAIGVQRDEAHTTPVVGLIVAGAPADKAGFKDGDQFVSVNSTPVNTPTDVRNDVATLVNQDKTANDIVPITIVVKREGNDLSLTVDARKHPPVNQGAMGIGFQNQYDHPAVIQLPVLAAQQVFVGNFQAVGEGFHEILAGVIKPQDAFSGPVGIVQVTSQAANAGWAPLLSLMAFLSWNLAVFNLLPIPGLDGGRLFLLFIEVLRRGRRLAPEREALINLAGLGLLLSLILIFTVNDVIRIVSGQ